MEVHLEGSKKDTIFWVTREETRLDAEDLINWDCPCIPDELKNGPCRSAFATSYACFARSKAEDKGSDCYDEFMKMSECLRDHPEVQRAYEPMS